MKYNKRTNRFYILFGTVLFLSGDSYGSFIGLSGDEYNYELNFSGS